MTRLEPAITLAMSHAQEEPKKANYDADMRLDVKVPMRDGVGVFADIGAGDISEGAHTYPL